MKREIEKGGEKQIYIYTCIDSEGERERER